jgi:hypothetical protein
MGRFAYQPRTTLGLARAGRLTQSDINAGATGHSYFVDAADEQAAKVAGRLAMIADGKAPGTILHVDLDPDGSDRWEVVMTHRPLRTGEGWQIDGTRFGTSGSKATGFDRDEWSYGR